MKVYVVRVYRCGRSTESIGVEEALGQKRDEMYIHTQDC